ncbi:sigma-70 domain-containing protein [Longispora sp. NPDC051575]|uniref:sigma-70 domain-containing protein n=1 Tax=Longispora sp. NPDC051575 TaxID=3154943 RepID=UPI0034185636
MTPTDPADDPHALPGGGTPTLHAGSGAVGTPVPILQLVREPLSLTAAAATTRLARKLHRTPTTAEIAVHLGVDAHELATALGAAQAAFLTSLNADNLATTAQPSPRSEQTPTIAGGYGDRLPPARPSRMDITELVRATVARLRRDLRHPSQLTEPGGDVLSRGEDITTRHATRLSKRSPR